MKKLHCLVGNCIGPNETSVNFSSSWSDQSRGQESRDVRDENNFRGLAQQWRGSIRNNSKTNCRFWSRSHSVRIQTIFERFRDSSSHRSSFIGSGQLQSQSGPSKFMARQICLNILSTLYQSDSTFGPLWVFLDINFIILAQNHSS